MPILLEFAPYALVFGALLLAFLALYLVRWLDKIHVGFVGVLTPLGGYTDKLKHALVQALTNAVGAAYQGYDKLVGASLHRAAREIDRFVHANLLTSAALTSLTKVLPNLTTTKTVRLSKTIVKTGALGLAAEVAKLQAQVSALAHDAVAIPAAVPEAIPRVIPGAIPALRKRVGHVEKAIPSLWKWIMRHRISLGSLAFAGGVAAALARMGGSWVRCRNMSKLGKGVCRSPEGWIEDLLGGAILLAGTVSVVEFVKDAQAIEDEAIAALRLFIRDFPGH